jgi:hypothetical protein
MSAMAQIATSASLVAQLNALGVMTLSAPCPGCAFF